MNRVFARGIEAYYKQVYFCDPAIDPWAHLIFDFTTDNFQARYILVNKYMFCLLTSGVIEWRWVEIHLSDSYYEFPEHERLLGINISITSGQLGILDLINREIHPIDVPKGDYIAYIFEFNRGVDDEDDPDCNDIFNDEILEQRTELEHYKIVLVPGRIENEGVIKGDQYLY